LYPRGRIQLLGIVAHREKREKPYPVSTLMTIMRVKPPKGVRGRVCLQRRVKLMEREREGFRGRHDSY